MSVERIAIVTGANKGIGYAIVKGLCEKFTGKVYLTSRDGNRGREAVEKLRKLGFHPSYHQLDIDHQTSVDVFKSYIAVNYGGIDVLVNNAAIAHKYYATEDFSVQVDNTVKTNYFGTLRVSEALIPLMRENGRIVNISSSEGHLSKVPSAQLKSKLTDPDLTIEKLNDLMNQSIRAAKEDPYIGNTWGKYALGISKFGVTALTRVYQNILDSEIPCRNISVNCVHPGYVRTNMTNFRGHLTIEEGAEAPLYLALDPHALKGQFIWKDCRVVDWITPNFPSPY